MDAELTIQLDKEIMERAEQYAANQKMSLSNLIENYLNALTSIPNGQTMEISEFVKSMSSKVPLPIDFDYKKEIANHVEQKYK